MLLKNLSLKPLDDFLAQVREAQAVQFKAKSAFYSFNFSTGLPNNSPYERYEWTAMKTLEPKDALPQEISEKVNDVSPLLNFYVQPEEKDQREEKDELQALQSAVTKGINALNGVLKGDVVKESGENVGLELKPKDKEKVIQAEQKQLID